MITEDGRTETEIKRRSEIAREKFSEMKNLLTSKRLSLGLRKKILSCYIYSVFMYGSETWTLTKTLEKKINALEMWCLRRMGRISWKEMKTNNEVCNIMQTKPDLLAKIKTRKLNYFGHIQRHNNVCKMIMEGKVEGKRARGRQRTTWIDNIRDWTSQPMSWSTRKASNREEWRIIARRPLSQR